MLVMRQVVHMQDLLEWRWRDGYEYCQQGAPHGLGPRWLDQLDLRAPITPERVPVTSSLKWSIVV